jgi:Skp family chaperone for outer membrane proteins
MNKYFTYIRDLMNYIFLKEQDKEKIKEELEKIRKDKEENLNKIQLENVNISDALMNEEEMDETLKYKLIPYGLIILFLGILYISISSGIFNIKIFLGVISILLSFLVSNKLVKIVEEKYKRLRKERKSFIDKLFANREQLLGKNKELSEKEEKLFNLIREIETDIADKKAYVTEVENAIITYLAPTLDGLIHDEITKNNNLDLLEVLERIKEL